MTHRPSCLSSPPDHAAVGHAQELLAFVAGRTWLISPEDPRLVVEDRGEGHLRTVAAFLRPEDAELAVVARNLLPRLV